MKYFSRIQILLLITLSILTVRCSQDYNPPSDREAYFEPLDPNDVNRLNESLDVNGENTSGNISLFSNSTKSTNLKYSERYIESYIGTASVTKDNTLFLPLLLNEDIEVESVFIQIMGASSYWKLDAPQVIDRSFSISIGIPYYILNGEFEIIYILKDSNGIYSELIKTIVNIISPISDYSHGQFDKVSGNSGLTIKTFEIPSGSGEISINYNTYTVKDRIDIQFNNNWIASTGYRLAPGESPQIKDCSNAVSGDGFVGERGVITIPYDSENNSKVDVYVSGCLNNGTAWEYSLSFSSQVQDQWYDDLPSCPCLLDKNTVSELNINDEKGEWIDYGEADDNHHFGAKREIRWIPDNRGDAGQQCTYDSSNRLITGGMAAGTPDKISPGPGLDKWYQYVFPSNYKAWRGHMAEDVNPWEEIPCYEYLRQWLPNNGNACYENTITDISYLSDSIKNKTCKEITEFLMSVEKSGSLELANYINKGKPISNDELLFNLCELHEELKLNSQETGIIEMLIDDIIDNNPEDKMH